MGSKIIRQWYVNILLFIMSRRQLWTGVLGSRRVIGPLRLSHGPHHCYVTSDVRVSGCQLIKNIFQAGGQWLSKLGDKKIVKSDQHMYISLRELSARAEWPDLLNNEHIHKLIESSMNDPLISIKWCNKNSENMKCEEKISLSMQYMYVFNIK